MEQTLEIPPPCPICERPNYHLMAHHLIPKEFGGTSKIKSCRDCHKAIHSCFTNKELRDYYHTIKRLLNHPKYAKMVAHIRKQDPQRKVGFKKKRRR